MHASLHRLSLSVKNANHTFSVRLAGILWHGYIGGGIVVEKWKEIGLRFYLQDEFIGTIIIISPFRHHNTTYNDNYNGIVTSLQVHFNSLCGYTYTCHKYKNVFILFHFLLRMNFFVCNCFWLSDNVEKCTMKKMMLKIPYKNGNQQKKFCTKMSWSLSFTVVC